MARQGAFPKYGTGFPKTKKKKLYAPHEHINKTAAAKFLHVSEVFIKKCYEKTFGTEAEKRETVKNLSRFNELEFDEKIAKLMTWKHENIATLSMENPSHEWKIWTRAICAILFSKPDYLLRTGKKSTVTVLLKGNTHGKVDVSHQELVTELLKKRSDYLNVIR